MINFIAGAFFGAIMYELYLSYKRYRAYKQLMTLFEKIAEEMEEDKNQEDKDGR